MTSSKARIRWNLIRLNLKNTSVLRTPPPATTTITTTESDNDPTIFHHTLTHTTSFSLKHLQLLVTTILNAPIVTKTEAAKAVIKLARENTIYTFDTLLHFLNHNRNKSNVLVYATAAEIYDMIADEGRKACFVYLLYTHFTEDLIGVVNKLVIRHSYIAPLFKPLIVKFLPNDYAVTFIARYTTALPRWEILVLGAQVANRHGDKIEFEKRQIQERQRYAQKYFLALRLLYFAYGTELHFKSGWYISSMCPFVGIDEVMMCLPIPSQSKVYLHFNLSISPPWTTTVPPIFTNGLWRERIPKPVKPINFLEKAGYCYDSDAVDPIRGLQFLPNAILILVIHYQDRLVRLKCRITHQGNALPILVQESALAIGSTIEVYLRQSDGWHDIGLLILEELDIEDEKILPPYTGTIPVRDHSSLVPVGLPRTPSSYKADGTPIYEEIARSRTQTPSRSNTYGALAGYDWSGTAFYVPKGCTLPMCAGYTANGVPYYDFNSILRQKDDIIWPEEREALWELPESQAITHISELEHSGTDARVRALRRSRASTSKRSAQNSDFPAQPQLLDFLRQFESFKAANFNNIKISFEPSHLEIQSAKGLVTRNLAVRYKAARGETSAQTFFVIADAPSAIKLLTTQIICQGEGFEDVKFQYDPHLATEETISARFIMIDELGRQYASSAITAYKQACLEMMPSLVDLRWTYVGAQKMVSLSLHNMSRSYINVTLKVVVEAGSISVKPIDIAEGTSSEVFALEQNERKQCSYALDIRGSGLFKALLQGFTPDGDMTQVVIQGIASVPIEVFQVPNVYEISTLFGQIRNGIKSDTWNELRTKFLSLDKMPLDFGLCNTKEESTKEIILVNISDEPILARLFPLGSEIECEDMVRIAAHGCQVISIHLNLASVGTFQSKLRILYPEFPAIEINVHAFAGCPFQLAHEGSIFMPPYISEPIIRNLLINNISPYPLEAKVYKSSEGETSSGLQAQFQDSGKECDTIPAMGSSLVRLGFQPTQPGFLYTIVEVNIAVKSTCKQDFSTEASCRIILMSLRAPETARIIDIALWDEIRACLRYEHESNAIEPKYLLNGKSSNFDFIEDIILLVPQQSAIGATTRSGLSCATSLCNRSSEQRIIHLMSPPNLKVEPSMLIIGGGETALLKVTFQPQADETKEAVLLAVDESDSTFASRNVIICSDLITVKHDASEHGSEIMPLTFNHVDISLGPTIHTKQLLITNKIAAQIEWKLTLTNNNNSAFSVSKYEGRLDIGEVFCCQVKFEAKEIGHQSCNLVLDVHAMIDGSQQDIDQSCNVELTADASVDAISGAPTDFDFGLTFLGQETVAAFTIRNENTIQTTLVFHTGGYFSLNPARVILDAGQSQEIQLCFAPTQTQNSAIAAYIYTESSVLSFGLSGSGGLVSLSSNIDPESGISFGSALEGSFSEQTILLLNDGTLPLKLVGLTSAIHRNLRVEYISERAQQMRAPRSSNERRQDYWHLIRRKLPLLASLSGQGLPLTLMAKSQHSELLHPSNPALSQVILPIMEVEDDLSLSTVERFADVPIIKPSKMIQLLVRFYHRGSMFHPVPLEFYYLPDIENMDNVDLTEIQPLRINLMGTTRFGFEIYPSIMDCGIVPADCYQMDNPLADNRADSYQTIVPGRLEVAAVNLGRESVTLHLKKKSPFFRFEEECWKLKSGEKLMLPFQFIPTLDHTHYDASLQFEHNNGSCNLYLAGIGGSCFVALDRDVINFGTIKQNTVYTQSVRLTNMGNIGGKYRISLAQSEATFCFTGDDPSELYGYLEAQEFHMIDIQVKPSRKAATESSLRILFQRVEGGKWDQITIPLKMYIGKPNLHVNKSSLDFAITYIRTSKTLGIILANSGDAECVWELEEDPNLPLNVTPQCGIIPSGNESSVYFTFAPATFTPIEGSLRLITDSGNFTVTYNGDVGVPYLKISQEDLQVDYGIRQISKTHLKPIHLINTGNHLLNWSIRLIEQYVSPDRTPYSPKVYTLSAYEGELNAENEQIVQVSATPIDYQVTVIAVYEVSTTSGERYTGSLSITGGQAMINIQQPTRTPNAVSKEVVVKEEKSIMPDSGSSFIQPAKLVSKEDAMIALRNHIKTMEQTMMSINATGDLFRVAKIPIKERVADMGLIMEEGGEEEELQEASEGDLIDKRTHPKQNSIHGQSTAHPVLRDNNGTIGSSANIALSNDTQEHQPDDMGRQLDNQLLPNRDNTNETASTRATGDIREQVVPNQDDISNTSDKKIDRRRASKRIIEATQTLGELKASAEKFLKSLESDTPASDRFITMELSRLTQEAKGAMTGVAFDIMTDTVESDASSNPDDMIDFKQAQDVLNTITASAEPEFSAQLTAAPEIGNATSEYYLGNILLGEKSTEMTLLCLPNVGNMVFEFEIKSTSTSSHENPFTILPLNGEVQPDSEVVVKAFFEAHALGFFEEEYQLESNGTILLTFAVSANVGRPNLICDLSHHDFPPTLRATSSSVNLTVTNTGTYTGEYTLEITAIEGDSPFKVEPALGKLQPEKHKEHMVTFVPPKANTLYDAMLVLKWYDKPIEIPLIGRGGSIELRIEVLDNPLKERALLDFGTCVVGMTYHRHVRLSNQGSCRAVIQIESPNEWLRYSCGQTLILQPQETSEVTVELSPLSKATIIRNIALVYHDGNMSIPVQAMCGTFLCQVTEIFKMLNVHIDEDQDQSITLNNTGDLDVYFSATLVTEFKDELKLILPNEKVLPNGKVATITLRARSAVAKRLTGEIQLTYGPTLLTSEQKIYPFNFYVFLDAFAIDDVSLVDVGHVMIGDQRNIQRTITNYGNDNVSYKVQMTESENWFYDGKTEGSLNPGEQVTLDVKFVSTSTDAEKFTNTALNVQYRSNLGSWTATPAVKLKGSFGIPRFVCIPNEQLLEFDHVDITQSSTRSIMIINEGSADLAYKLADPALPFRFAQGVIMEGIITSGQSQEIQCEFTPRVIDVYESTIEIITNTGPQRILLTGRGVSLGLDMEKLPNHVALLATFDSVTSTPILLYNGGDSSFSVLLEASIGESQNIQGLFEMSFDTNPITLQAKTEEPIGTPATLQLRTFIPRNDAQAIHLDKIIELVHAHQFQGQIVCKIEASQVSIPIPLLINVAQPIISLKCSSIFMDNTAADIAIDMGRADMFEGSTMTATLHNDNVFDVPFSINSKHFIVQPMEGLLTARGEIKLLITLAGLKNEPEVELPSQIIKEDQIDIHITGILHGVVSDLSIPIKGALEDVSLRDVFLGSFMLSKSYAGEALNDKIELYNPTSHTLNWKIDITEPNEQFQFVEARQGILKPRTTISLPIKFTSVVPGVFELQAIFVSEDGALPMVITAEAIEPAILVAMTESLQEESLAFGSVGTEDPESRTLTFTNSTDLPLTVISSLVSGNTQVFEISEDPMTLEPNEEGHVGVKFNPPDDGQEYEDTLEVRMKSTGALISQLGLRGRGGSFSMHTSEPALHLGAIKMADQAVRKFSITNTGTTDIGIQVIDSQTGQVADGLMLSRNRRASYRVSSASGKIKPGQELEVTVEVKGEELGDEDIDLEIQTTDLVRPKSVRFTTSVQVDEGDEPFKVYAAAAFNLENLTYDAGVITDEMLWKVLCPQVRIQKHTPLSQFQLIPCLQPFLLGNTIQEQLQRPPAFSTSKDAPDKRASSASYVETLEEEEIRRRMEALNFIKQKETMLSF